jgi:hypothetical protein
VHSSPERAGARKFYYREISSLGPVDYSVIST